MIVTPIKTRVLTPPQDDLLSVIKESVKEISEGSIFVVTSKVVSIWQGRCVPVNKVSDKDALIMEEAEKYLPRNETPGGWVMHTMKNNLLIPTAGIDESNAKDHYILWPKDIKKTTRDLWDWLKKTYKITKFGLIITDSHSIPLRRGVVGISLSHYGFSPLKDYRHTPDIFGREMKVSQTNVADSLAAAAGVVMGEGREQTPIAIIDGISYLQFGDRKEGDRFSKFEVSLEEDLYKPFIERAPWQNGGSYEK